MEKENETLEKENETLKKENETLRKENEAQKKELQETGATAAAEELITKQETGARSLTT